MDRKFHIFGVAVCTNEQEDDFVFLFKSVSRSAELLLGETVKPLVLVSDASKAIQNAFKSVFGAEATIIMCWFHMFKCVTKKLSTTNKFVRERIRSDISFLQLISSKSLFKSALALFLAKWAAEPDFINYFTEEWVHQNPNWYEGARLHVPSTNNALEATDRIIKDEFTHRMRYSLGEFVCGVLATMIGVYSRRCLTDQVYAAQPSITNKTWSAAYLWVKRKLTLQKRKLPNGDTIISINSSSYDPKKTIVVADWMTLDEFKLFYNSNWVITLAKTETKWINASCSCPKYQKEFICKHTVGIAMRMLEVSAPEEAKKVAICAKRKRGRQANAKKAYIIQ